MTYLVFHVTLLSLLRLNVLRSPHMVERMNQTLVQTIAKLKSDDQAPKNWNYYINNALFAIRTMVNDSTGCSPSMLLYGYELRTPANWSAP